MNKQKLLALVAVLGSTLSVSAHAALDSAVTAAITTAQGDLTALYAALTTAGVAIWIVRVIARKFSVR